MSSLEPLTTRLINIRHLIAAGDKETALDLLNQLLEEQHDAAAHGLRVRILAEDLRDIPRIHESLGWLERLESDNEILPDAFNLVQSRLVLRLKHLRREITDSGGGAQLAQLDELVLLADRFPQIHLVRGLALADAARPARDANGLSRLTRSLERRSNDWPLKYKSEDLSKQAEQALQRAVALAPAPDPVHREAVQALGALHEDITGDLNNALIWYRRALALGEPVGEKVEQMQRGIVKETIDRFTQHLDGLIDHQQFEKAALLLNSCNGLERLPAVRIRQADLALLRGDFNQAETDYGTLLMSLKQEPIVDIGSFNLEQVEPVRDLLPEDVLVPLSAESHLPCARYAIGHDDIARRAQAGLIAVYQRQEDHEKAYEALRDLLQDPKVTAKTVNVLLDDLKRIEMRIQNQTYEHLHKQISALWEAKDWQAVISICRQLVSSPGAQPSDFAWLAAAMHKAGEPFDAITYILNRVSPDAMRAIPGVVARALLRDLSQAGYWGTTDRYVLSVSNAGGWRTRYAERRTAFIHTLLEEAEHHLNGGKIDAADTGIRRILEIEPLHPRARLLMCRALFAKGNPSTARKGLLALLEEESVAHEALLTLAEIDVADGYLLDARKRLEELRRQRRDPHVEALARSLEHRINRTPVVQVEQLTTMVSPDTLRRAPASGMWAATFAVRLTSVRAVRQPPPVDERCAELLTALSRVSDNLGLQSLFAWRYIGHRGSLRVALLCRIEGAGTQESALAAAEALWDTLKGLLPLQDEQVYAYEPVMSEDELGYLRLPEQPNSAVEIARRESLIGVSEDDDVYMIFPFAYHEGNLHRLLRALAEQPETTILDIHFQPTLLLPWERTAIKNMMDIEADDSLNGGLGFSGSSQVDERYQQAQHLYPEFMRHTQWMAFVVRIHLMTTGRINTALPNIAATSLFGASRYEIVPANFEQDLETIQTNLRDVNGERWGYSAAPSRLERLRYLLMPGEALTATRVPAPGPDGLPGLPALKIKAAPLPANLPKKGVLIGESVTPVQGQPVTVRAGLSDRMRHTYVVGRTGTGKSTLLQNLALQDIEAGHGVGVIDPHGDLVEAILERIPAHRLQDVVLFDPSDTDRPVGLNILDVKGTFEKNMVVAEFIGLMYSMFDPHKMGIVGPRFENAVRNAMLTAMEIPGSTLVEVVRILSDRTYLKDCLDVVTDPVVRSYWRDIVGNQSDFHKSEVLDYITSKFGRFVTDHLVRNIIGQSENALDFADIMDNGQILLVNLAKGKIGPQNSHFLGLLLVPRLLIAALSRARMEASDRRLFSLYVDEFHNFTTPAFSVMLSEARKYSMALTVANQFISQLDDAIRESVFGNIGTLLTFQVGIKDAHFLLPEMYPVFDVDDMVNLPNYHLLAKMLINGNVAPQFPVRTLPDSRVADERVAATIRAHSRQRYGRESLIVGYEIQQRFNQTPKERLKDS